MCLQFFLNEVNVAFRADMFKMCISVRELCTKTSKLVVLRWHRCAVCNGLCRFLLTKSTLCSFLNNFSKSPILLVDRTAHPARHIVLKTADERQHVERLHR